MHCQAIPLSKLWPLQTVEREGRIELRRVNEIGILKGDLKPILADQEPPHALLQLSHVCNLPHLPWHLTVTVGPELVRAEPMQVETLGNSDACGDHNTDEVGLINIVRHLHQDTDGLDGSESRPGHEVGVEKTFNTLVE